MAPQCGASSSIPSPDYHFSPLELEVCQILLQLPNLIAKSEFSSRGLSPWGRTQKRSALNSTPPPSASASASASASLSSPPLSLPDSALVVSPPVDSEQPPPKKVKVKELSPTTPLSVHSVALSPSESDENAKRSNKKVSLKKKAEWLKEIEELTKCKQELEGEVEAVKRYHDHLKTVNSRLWARKKEMILGDKNNESTQPGGSSSNTTMEIDQQPPVKSSPILKTQQQHHHHHLQPPIKNQTASTPEPSQRFQAPLRIAPSYDDTMGPNGIPDLNVSLEELTHHRNYNKYVAFQARQNRIRIWKTKNANSTTKMHCR